MSNKKRSPQLTYEKEHGPCGWDLDFLIIELFIVRTRQIAIKMHTNHSTRISLTPPIM